MTFRVSPASTAISIALICLLAGLSSGASRAQSSGAGSASSPNSSKAGESSSSGQAFAREKAPTLIDSAGPTVSLISAEPVFLMAAALNACGYDDGKVESAPVRKRVRDEMNLALEKSEDARAKRDRLCL